MNISVLFVYIAEAHAIDEWPVGDHYLTGRRIQQQKTVAARVEEALTFQQKFDITWPIVVDNPEEGDQFLNLFAAWPTRFFLIRDGKFTFIAEPCEEHLMHVEDIENAIDNALLV